jgi:EAL domain-containing protein (putative c-di-GMP-specific phosphodiesterase class I)
VEKCIAALRKIIAIDVLGVGCAGMTSFAFLEPKVVKVIDTTRVGDVGKMPVNSKLIRSVCTARRELNVTVVADWPIERGHDLLQGCLTRSRPVFPAFARES